MTKDEMKNRISLALKDPILQQGFEIICKNLAELEETNADLKQSLDWANERESEDIKRITDLEKENAELKQANEGKVVEHFEAYGQCRDSRKIAELEAQIEKMKSDVMRNVKWADQNKNGQMYCKLNVMFNQWEIKEKK